MPPIFNINDAFFIDGRPAVIIAFRHQGKGRKHVQPRYCFRGLGERLLTDIIIRHHVTVRIRYFQVITEHLVEFDAQILNAGLLPFLCFQLHQPALALRLCLAQLVNLLVITLFEDTAVPDGNGRFFRDGRID